VAKRAVKSKERSQSQEGEEKEGGGKLTTPMSEGSTLATLPVVREAISYDPKNQTWMRPPVNFGAFSVSLPVNSTRGPENIEQLQRGDIRS
jgi:hypothetical protein